MSLIPTVNIYTTYNNKYYNPDNGHDSKMPGNNANWLALQKAFYDVNFDVQTAYSQIAALDVRVSALENPNT